MNAVSIGTLQGTIEAHRGCGGQIAAERLICRRRLTPQVG
jgi:hypothetical protein